MCCLSAGIWYNLLRGLSKLAVIVNVSPRRSSKARWATVLENQWVSCPQAFVIAFTSDFIPRLVYQYTYSPDGTMHGFINHSLSYFNVSDFEPGTDPLEPMNLGSKVEICR